MVRVSFRVRVEVRVRDKQHNVKTSSTPCTNGMPK